MAPKHSFGFSNDQLIDPGVSPSPTTLLEAQMHSSMLDSLADFDHTIERNDVKNQKLWTEWRKPELFCGSKKSDVENQNKKSKLNCVQDFKQCVDGDIDLHWHTSIKSDLEYYCDTGSETYSKYQSEQSGVREDDLYYCSEKGSLDKSVSEKYWNAQIPDKLASEKYQSTHTKIEGDILIDEKRVAANRFVAECVESVAMDYFEEHSKCLPKNLKTDLIVECCVPKNGECCDVIDKLAEECSVNTPEICHGVDAMMVSPCSWTSSLYSQASCQYSVASSLQNYLPMSALCINTFVYLISIEFDVSWKVASHVVAESTQREWSQMFHNPNKKLTSSCARQTPGGSSQGGKSSFNADKSGSWGGGANSPSEGLWSVQRGVGGGGGSGKDGGGDDWRREKFDGNMNSRQSEEEEKMKKKRRLEEGVINWLLSDCPETLSKDETELLASHLNAFLHSDHSPCSVCEILRVYVHNIDSCYPETNKCLQCLKVLLVMHRHQLSCSFDCHSVFENIAADGLSNLDVQAVYNSYNQGHLVQLFQTTVRHLRTKFIFEVPRCHDNDNKGHNIESNRSGCIEGRNNQSGIVIDDDKDIDESERGTVDTRESTSEESETDLAVNVISRSQSCTDPSTNVNSPSLFIAGSADHVSSRSLPFTERTATAIPRSYSCPPGAFINTQYSQLYTGPADIDEDSDDDSIIMPLSDSPKFCIPMAEAAHSLPMEISDVPCEVLVSPEVSVETSVLVARGLKEECIVASVQKQGSGVNLAKPCVDQFHSIRQCLSEELGAHQLKTDTRLLSIPVRRSRGQMHYGSTEDLRCCARMWRNYSHFGQGKNQFALQGVILNDAKMIISIVNGNYEEDQDWYMVSDSLGTQPVFIGAGMAGKCFAGVDYITKHGFCVKKINFAKFDAEELVVWSYLNSSCIVQLYGAMIVDDVVFIFEELITGPTLKEYISRPVRINAYEALELFEQLLHILRYLKQQCVIHNDIKADNIMLRIPSNRLVLIDYGLASRTDYVKQDVNPVGAQTHWSPEKAASEGYDFGADLWAAVCVFVHILSGSEPWLSRYPTAGFLHLIIHRTSPPIQDIPSGLLDEIYDLILSGWTVAVRDRPSVEHLLKHRAFALLGEPNSPSDAKFCQHYVAESTGHESIVSWTSVSDDVSKTQESYDFNESDGEQLLAELYQSIDVGSLSMMAELQALRRDFTLTETEQQQEDHEVEIAVGNDEFPAVVDNGSSPLNVGELNNNSSAIVSHCATSSNTSVVNSGQSIQNHESSINVAKIHANQLILERYSGGSALRLKPEVLKKLASQFFSRLSSNAVSNKECLPIVDAVRNSNSITQKEDPVATTSVSTSQDDGTPVLILRSVSIGVNQTVTAQTSISSSSNHWSPGQHKSSAGDPWAGDRPKTSNGDQNKTPYGDQSAGARPKTSSYYYLTQQTDLTPGNDGAGQTNVMLPLFVDSAVLSDEETEEESSPLIPTVESCDYQNNKTVGLESKTEETVRKETKETRRVELHGSDTPLANICKDASQRLELDVEKQCNAEDELFLEDAHFTGFITENNEPVNVPQQDHSMNVSSQFNSTSLGTRLVMKYEGVIVHEVHLHPGRRASWKEVMLRASKKIHERGLSDFMALLNPNIPISLEEDVDVDKERFVEVTILPVSADWTWKIANQRPYSRSGPFRPSWDN